MRVYELAKELGVQSKEVLAVLHEKGIDASNHMAVLSDKAVAHVRGKLDSKSVKKKESVAQPARTVAAKDLQIKKQEKTENKTIKKEEPVVHASAAKKTVPVEKVKIEAEKRVVEKVVEKPKIVVGASQEIERSMPEELRNKDIEPVELRPPVKLPVGNLEDIEEQELREQERIRRLLKTPSLAGFAVGLQPQARRRRRRRSRPAAETIAQQPKGPITEITVDGSKALYEVADMLGKNSGDLILYFLKKGSAWNRNHVLDVDVIREVAQHFGIAAHIKKTEEAEKKTDIRQSLRDVQEGVARWPVVVVMGHVDHGKTTLLDYIRKMNVAATEKGGITQHIRAWDVDSVHGKIVFLDTPGHEAFSYLRQRGSHITDVVVLVVAADDGIMPQTVEAIKYAKEASVPIVVAINKIDKASSPAALETVKRQLAQHDLMPEEWGGETVIVPVSAKTGKGVDELLEMIVLQSQLLDLKADVNKPAKAFVLESNIEKGLGPVATVICKEGILKPGDYFTCGTTTGKVRILIDSRGKKITQAGPSTPVQVVGFDGFSGIEDWLVVVSQQEYAKAKGRKTIEAPAPMQFTQQQDAMHLPTKKEKVINLIIKTDTRGSKEALTGSLDKLQKAHKDIKCPIYIITSSIGDIIESDVELAANTNAIIVGLHVKIEKNAQLLAKDRGVDVHNYYIIYELVEAIEKLLLSKKEIKMHWAKVGEATVKKVFDIKGTGIIAGCYMRDGLLTRGNKVECVRSGRVMGEGKVTTLQRDRKSVKEVHAGYECGFTCDGFNEWAEGDTVLSYAEVKAE